MERVEELCCYYIALIRAVYLIHQNHHWITKGENFYGNHLLFERIYKSAAEDADLAAEKFIGLFGTEVLDLQMQAQMIGKIMENFSSGDPVGTSLKAEKKFLDFSEKFYRILKSEEKMTLGLDDMLMAIASNREGAVYLLKQATTGAEEMNSKMAARVNLLKRVKRAQQTVSTQPFNQGDFLRKLQTEWNALVPSYVQGQYDAKDLVVTIEPGNAPNGAQQRVIATAKLPKAIAPELQQKIENNFRQYALSLLPAGMRTNYMISVGFVMPPARALPSS